jgi:hypothetical protein
LRTGAREAAAEVLSLVVDERDVQRARALWSDALLGSLPGVSAAIVPDLLRLFAGDPPSLVHQRRRHAAELADLGEPGGVPGEAFLALCARFGVSVEEALPVAARLRQLFPSTDPAGLLGACSVLWPAVSPWRDWAGLLSVLRSFPVQREWTLAAFAQGLAAWAPVFDDPYDLLRAVQRRLAERVPLAEVLASPP